MTNEEAQKIIDGLATLAERNNLNKQLREVAAKAAEILRGWTEQLKETPWHSVVDEDSVELDIAIPGLPTCTIKLEEYAARQLVAKFRQPNPPVFACNLPGGGLWEVDLKKVAAISSDWLEAPEEEAQEEERKIPSYKKKDPSKGWRWGEVTCHNCGADYEANIHERWTFVRCKYCHETDTTVTYPDD